MEQYIKFLESEEANKQYFIGNPKLKEAVKRLIKENKELRENSVPVSLVEETKKELYDNYINSNGDNFLKLEHQLEILDKLLEKRK